MYNEAFLVVQDNMEIVGMVLVASFLGAVLAVAWNRLWINRYW